MSAVHKSTSQGGRMNKAKLIEKVSERVRIPSNAAKVIVDTIFDSKRESPEKDEGIEIRGFGCFVIRKYGVYKGRNPKTGKTVDVRPKKLPYFKVGKEMKGLVNNLPKINLKNEETEQP
jgi:integration host factor subunit beta